MTRFPILLVLAAGCGGSGSDGGDADADTDADSDTDVDSDADTDSETTTETSSETSSETGSETGDPCPVPDADADGHDRIDCGGDDCDDANPLVHPGAPDSGPEIDTVEIGTPGGRPSLSIAPDGMPHVAFQDANDVGQYDLRIGSLEDAGWDVDTYVRDFNVGNWVPLEVDGAGALHAAFTADVVRYGTNASGAWIDEPALDLGGGPVDFDLDDDGKAHITWTGGVEGDVVYGTNASGEWIQTTVDDVGYTSGRAAIALAPNGDVHVVSWNGELRHSTNATGAWASESIGPTNGQTPDVAIGEDGTVHVAYSETGTLDLWYATDATGDWELERVDDVPFTFDVSIAVDPGGHVHLAYSVGGEEEVRYATDASGDWEIEVVDDDGWTGRNPSIDTDSAVVQIAYLDVDENAIKRAVLAPIDGIDQDCDGVER